MRFKIPDETMKMLNDKSWRDSVWPTACAHCPSMREPDPEALMIEQMVKTGEMQIDEALFPCAWRQKNRKICHGLMKRLGCI
jgi:hypothetical protein